MTVLSDAAGGSLGLAEDDVFYFGNAIGETGDSPTNAKVNATDQLGTRSDIHTASNSAAIFDAYDFDRDGLISPYSADELIARSNQTTFLTELKLITAPIEPVAAPVPEMLPGDATMDGRVDGADLQVLGANFGTIGATWSQGDFDGDGDVDVEDYITLKVNFGRSLPEEASVPELPSEAATSVAPAAAVAIPTGETPVVAAMTALLSDTVDAPTIAPVVELTSADTWTISAAAPTISAIEAVSVRRSTTAAMLLAQPPTDARLWAGLFDRGHDQAPMNDSLVEPLLGRLRAIRWQDDLRTGRGMQRKMRV